MFSLEVTPEHAAHGLLCSSAALLPLHPQHPSQGSAQGFHPRALHRNSHPRALHRVPSPADSKSPWGTQLCPKSGLKPQHSPGGSGAGQSRGHSPARGQQGTHRHRDTQPGSWDMPREKPFPFLTLKWLCRAGPRLAPAEERGRGWSSAAPPLLQRSSVSHSRGPAPKLCLWSRFLTGFSLEMGTSTFSCSPTGCHTIPFAPSLYDNLFPLFSHHQSVHTPDLSFTVLALSLAYVSLNIKRPKMIPTK